MCYCNRHGLKVLKNSPFYFIWVCKLVFMCMKVCYIDTTDGQMAYFRECVRCEMMRSTHLDRMQVC